MVEATNLAGQVIGNYQIGKYLGHTGIAHVYQATRPGLNQLYSLNILPSHFGEDQGFIDHFIAEAIKLSALKHNAIVAVQDFGAERGFPYLVMDYVEGPTLKDLLNSANRRMVRVPVGVTVFVINRVGEALAYAHEQGIAHCDVRMNNVILQRSGEIMLTDFGLARLMEWKNPPAVANAPGWSSQDSSPNGQSDMSGDAFSLGVIFYQLATGRLPYDAETQTFERGQDRQGASAFTPPSDFFPEIPVEVEGVIVKAIARDPAQRYASVRAMLEDLSRFSQTVKTTALPAARLSDIASFSSRFSSATTPFEFEPQQQQKVALHFLDTGQILDLKRGEEYTIGRRHPSQAVIPDIDLTPFKAYEWGISRLHARIKVEGNQVEILDLGSSNGTWHAGKRVSTDTPYKLLHGDIVILGKLRIQVLISN
jgi:serine/threonine protein kinase